MATEKLIGYNCVVTSYKDEIGDRDAKVVEVEGDYRFLSEHRYEIIDENTPGGYTVESSSLSSTGNGFGKLTIRCVFYVSSSSFNAERETVRVDMLEVDFKLQHHPHLSKRDRKIAELWLATDPSQRYDDEQEKFYYLGAGNSLLEIDSNLPNVLKFCKSWVSGIETFRRYYPVVEKISVWKNPPGLTKVGRSFKSGSPDFSENIGRYNNPPISLNGYPSGKWFKSKDSWVQNADTTWTRTEQWTYTPDAANSDNGWIYTNI